MESIWSKRGIKTLVYLALAGYAAGMLAAGPAVSAAVAEGVEICWRVLVPSLFPFLVFSGTAADCGLLEELGAGLDRLTTALYRLPGCCGSIWLMGALGGYPLGVRATLDLYRAGALGREAAERMLGFCACCGPGFLLGTVGLSVFGSAKTGLILLAIHWTGSLLIGFLLTRNLSLQVCNTTNSRSFQDPVSAFTGAVRGAVGGVGAICGFYLFFRGLMALLPAGSPGWLLGFLEMSCGVLALDGPPHSLPLAAGILGWGGLSVHCQAMDLLQGSGLRVRYYWGGKLLHGLLSWALCRLVLLFL